ncbi:MAG: Zn-ribbon domain-containing OB-fold protein [Proteobacteria bacterium]|nr:Zn-ribbon domain-containing OB-fold protein [Pseudomonadota bacterium]
MAYLPEGTPLPAADLDDSPYWEGCRRRELRIQRCADCGRFRHPPSPVCPACRSFGAEFVEVPGTGTVFTYTVAHHPVHPALKAAVPYNIAVVLLDGAGDVRLVSNVVDARPGEMAVGMRVRLRWEPTSDGSYLPRFEKA